MKNKNVLNKIAAYIAKAAEILHWIGAVSALALAVCTYVGKDVLTGVLLSGNGEVSCYGFEITVLNSNGELNSLALIMFSIGAAIIMSLFAMIFRNAYLILKTADGKTWFSKGTTPFQKDIVRMLREIGIFLISVPVAGLVVSIVARMAIGVESAEISVRFDEIVMGLLALCLSSFFAYGVEIQNDVDGLL